MATCSVLDAEAPYTTRSPAEYTEQRAERYESFEFLHADREVRDRVLEVQRHLALRSMTRAVGIADLVAAVAERHRVTVLHYDGDVDHVAAPDRAAGRVGRAAGGRERTPGRWPGGGRLPRLAS